MAEMQKEMPEGGQRMTIEPSKGGIDIGGHITLGENVVAKIASMASRGIEGIHSLGRSRFISFGDTSRRGVAAEVGETEAALDVDIILEYGTDIRKTASELRRAVAAEVERMAGRKVVEVNVNILDIHLPETEAPSPQPRVQ